MPRNVVKLEMLAADARLSIPEETLIEITGKMITAKDLKAAIAEPLAGLTLLSDTQVLTGKGISYTVADARHEVDGIASRRHSARQQADTSLKTEVREARLRLNQQRAAVLSENRKQIMSLAKRLTANPAAADLHILNFGPGPAATASPQISGVFGASQDTTTNTSNRFWPNMSMAILGTNLGDTPGQVLIRYQRFDGTTTEAEMSRERLGANNSGPDWNPFVLLMRLPDLTGFLRQSATIRLIRADGAETEFRDIPLEPFDEWIHLSQQIAPALQIHCEDGFSVATECESNDDRTFYASHTGIGEGTDTCELPRLQNGWKVVRANLNVHEPDLNLAESHVITRVLVNDDLVRFAIKWHVGGLPSIPYLGGVLPIVGDITITLNVLMLGAKGVPFQ
jgi:hypothetical protein